MNTFLKDKKKKYNNASCTCKQGHWHQSRGEAGYCNELRLQQKGRMFYAYEIQKKYDLSITGVHISNHYVDFAIYQTKLDFDSGTVTEVREFKGFEKGEWLMKRRLFEAIYPRIPYKTIRG